MVTARQVNPLLNAIDPKTDQNTGPFESIFNDWVKFGQAVLSVILGIEQQAANEEAAEETKKRFWAAIRNQAQQGERTQQGLTDLEEALSGRLTDLGGQGQADLVKLESTLASVARKNTEADVAGLEGLRESETGGLRDLLRENLGAFDEFANPIIRDFEGRESRLLGELEGSGEQERRDIIQRGGQSEQASLFALAERGLGGSTISSSVRRGSAQNLTADLARLEERLRGERFDAGAELSADTLAAQTAFGLDRFNIGSAGRGAIFDTESQFNRDILARESGGRDENLALVDRFGSARFDLSQGIGQQLAQLAESFGLSRLDADIASTAGMNQILGSATNTASGGQATLNAQSGLGAANAPRVEQPSVLQQGLTQAIPQIVTSAITGGVAGKRRGNEQVQERSIQDFLASIFGGRSARAA